MLKTLKAWLARFRAWRAENERAHRNAKVSPCCSNPGSAYAVRRQDKGK